MRYQYHIYESPELIAATFETIEPLPHLSVGAQLVLTTDGYSQRIGTALVIEQARVVISHLRGDFARYDIHVFCRVEEQPLPR